MKRLLQVKKVIFILIVRKEKYLFWKVFKYNISNQKLTIKTKQLLCINYIATVFTPVSIVK